MSISAKEFALRRKRLLENMGKGSVAIIASASELIRNGDTHFPFRQNSDFYYLTGFPEAEAIAVLIPGRAQGEYILFNRPRDVLKETWNGRRAGQEGACKHYGADEAYSITEFSKKLPELLTDCERVCYSMGRQPELDKIIMAAVEIIRGKVRTGISAPIEFFNIEYWLHEMRLIKSAEEIAVMRKAAMISSAAHKRAMKKCKPGLFEYQIEAELQHEFFSHGSRACAYESIVAAGENSCILHYCENTAVLKSGELLLIDAGCEYENYASDITRTFPINGKFSAEQRAIYEIVLAAQLAAIAAVRPDISWEAPHHVAVRVLTEGLVNLGLLHGDVEQLIATKAYDKFYMHRTSHWLGMDVHDVGSYRPNGEWRKLQAGMVLTIEPGIYIAAHTPGVEEKWWNIGVRIEDDVLVTAEGCEVLSAAAPKSVAEIEELVGKAAN